MQNTCLHISHGVWTGIKERYLLTFSMQTTFPSTAGIALHSEVYIVIVVRQSDGTPSERMTCSLETSTGILFCKVEWQSVLISACLKSHANSLEPLQEQCNID
eukprot:3327678-Amphidinium_carterae.3